MFGLAEEIDDRLVQGEGYIVVLPPPGRVAALLRAGGGAQVLDGAAASPEIDAVDFDAGGAAVVSGAATRGQSLKLSVDQTPAAEGRADARGRFAIGLSAMLRPGHHALSVQQPGGQAGVQVAIRPAPAISGLPFRGAREASDWRIDWTTPGGGVQTALLIDSGVGAASGSTP
jgi:hypothetical protein